MSAFPPPRQGFCMSSLQRRVGHLEWGWWEAPALHFSRLSGWWLWPQRRPHHGVRHTHWLSDRGRGVQSHFLSLGITWGHNLDRQASLAGEVGTLPVYTCLCEGSPGQQRAVRAWWSTVRSQSEGSQHQGNTMFCLKFDNYSELGQNLVIRFRTDGHPFTCRVTCLFGVPFGKQFGYMYWNPRRYWYIPTFRHLGICLQKQRDADSDLWMKMFIPAVFTVSKYWR